MKRMLALLLAALLCAQATGACAQGLFGKGLEAAGDAVSSLLEGNPFAKEKEEPKDFKELMDEYEAFFDEYIAFMKKCDTSSGDLSLLVDYTTMVTRYTEAMEALDEIDEDELSDEEKDYYLEVLARINVKLAKFAQEIN